jgi:hypothetical protein
VNDMLMVGIASGVGVTLATVWMWRRTASLEPKLDEVLQREQDLTASELAERIGLGGGWFATGRVLQALHAMVARGALVATVPADTPLTKRARATRYRVKTRRDYSLWSLPEPTEHAKPPSRRV